MSGLLLVSFIRHSMFLTSNYASSSNLKFPQKIFHDSTAYLNIVWLNDENCRIVGHLNRFISRQRITMYRENIEKLYGIYRLKKA